MRRLVKPRLLLEIDETSVVSIFILAIASVDEELAFEVSMWPEEKITRFAKNLREKILTECSIGKAEIVVDQDTRDSRTDN
jgi:hypothetical protein